MRSFNLQKILSKVSPSAEIDLDLLSTFPRLMVEIGAGTGLHPINFARENPDTLVIGVEKTTTRFSKFHRQAKKEALKNLVPVHAHAVSWISQNIKEGSIDEIFLLYPNPNPKKKDLNKRWHAMPFFGHLIQLLKPSGKITIRTNEEFYALEAKQFIQDVWKKPFLFREVLPKEIQEAKTLFEKKYLERGQTCYEIKLHNNEDESA